MSAEPAEVRYTAEQKGKGRAAPAPESSTPGFTPQMPPGRGLSALELGRQLVEAERQQYPAPQTPDRPAPMQYRYGDGSRPESSRMAQERHAVMAHYMGRQGVDEAHRVGTPPGAGASQPAWMPRGESLDMRAQVEAYKAFEAARAPDPVRVSSPFEHRAQPAVDYSRSYNRPEARASLGFAPRRYQPATMSVDEALAGGRPTGPRREAHVDLGQVDLEQQRAILRDIEARRQERPEGRGYRPATHGVDDVLLPKGGG
ncbi:MAG: hypothetical protein ABW123_15760 [Cystobacter sp.]